LHTDPPGDGYGLAHPRHCSSNCTRLVLGSQNLQSRSPELQNYDQLPEVDSRAHCLVLRCGFHDRHGAESYWKS